MSDIRGQLVELLNIHHRRGITIVVLSPQYQSRWREARAIFDGVWGFVIDPVRLLIKDDKSHIWFLPNDISIIKGLRCDVVVIDGDIDPHFVKLLTSHPDSMKKILQWDLCSQ